MLFREKDGNICLDLFRPDESIPTETDISSGL